MSSDPNSHNQPVFSSANSDNRKFCLAIQRQKFCFDTYEKAKKACEFSDNPQRVYYCKFCCAYHTTHFLKKSGYINSYASDREKKIANLIRPKYKPLIILDAPRMTQTIRRAKSKPYHPVVKKFLVEYLISTTDDISLSDAELRQLLSEMLLQKDDEIFGETLKWPFCDLESAMSFYALYYVQKKKFFIAMSAGELSTHLFKSHHPTDKVGRRLSSLFKENLIIFVDNGDGRKRFKFDDFSESYTKHTTPISVDNGVENIEAEVEVAPTDSDPIINAAYRAKYHPVVKDMLLKHLKENRFEEYSIQKDYLEKTLNQALINKQDEIAQKAITETLKWPSYTEKQAWRFFAVYYLEQSGGVFAHNPGDIVDTLLLQGAHSNSFMNRVRKFFNEAYKAGDLVITKMKGDTQFYELRKAD